MLNVDEKKFWLLTFLIGNNNINVEFNMLLTGSSLKILTIIIFGILI